MHKIRASVFQYIQTFSGEEIIETDYVYLRTQALTRLMMRNPFLSPNIMMDGTAKPQITEL